MSDCLSGEQLAALPQGRLPTAQATAADAHLDGCERCARAEVLEHFAADLDALATDAGVPR